MRWRRATWSRYAAWLGVVALACNATLPVVLAFSLSAALAAPLQREWVRLADGNWRFVGELCRHHDDGGSTDRHGKRPGAPCPVCGLQGALAVTLPAPAASPAGPVAIAAPAAPQVALAEPANLFPASYRSRAPPSA